MSDRSAARQEAVAPAHVVPSVALAHASLEDLHELRVRIPESLHRQLLSLKVLRGQSLADTVARALDAYFAQVERARREARAAATAGT